MHVHATTSDRVNNTHALWCSRELALEIDIFGLILKDLEQHEGE